MVTALSQQQQANIKGVFASPPCWGYQFSKPPEPVLSPERAHPPQLRPAKLIPRSQGTRLPEAAILAAVAGVGALILDITLGYFKGHIGVVELRLVVLVHFVAAVVAFWAGRAWQRSRPGAESTFSTSQSQRYVRPGVNALVAFLIPYIILPI